jgi:phosphoribosyl-AMP cyclohydrolase
MPAASVFAEPGSREEVEQGSRFTPRLNADGLIGCIACEAKTGDVLMFAWMNEEALKKTIETGQAHYWSRSRKELWHKGATSGMVQNVVEMRVDCDQDTILMKVRVDGPVAACHMGYRSCFYRSVPAGQAAGADMVLRFEDTDPVFDPDEVYPR